MFHPSENSLLPFSFAAQVQKLKLASSKCVLQPQCRTTDGCLSAALSMSCLAQEDEERFEPTDLVKVSKAKAPGNLDSDETCL